MNARALVVTVAIVFASSTARAEDASALPPNRVHEPYLASGGVVYSSPRRSIVGASGGLGYRVNVSRTFSFHLEGKEVFFTGNAFVGSAGLTVRRVVTGAWEPMGGLQGSIYGGQSVQIVSSKDPELPPPTAWAAQLRVAPLRFVKDSFAVSALVFDAGIGLDGGVALALGLDVLEIGLRF